MMSVFSDMVRDTVEVFMDDFYMVGDSFDQCLSHLAKVFKRCEDCNLALNWKKSQFIVKEGLVLDHRNSEKGIEVDRAKVSCLQNT